MRSRERPRRGRVSEPQPCLVSAPIGQAIHRLLLIQAFRPDRLLAMAHVFVSTNLGESFMSIMEQPLDLTHIVDTEVRCGHPGSPPRQPRCRLGRALTSLRLPGRR